MYFTKLFNCTKCFSFSIIRIGKLVAFPSQFVHSTTCSVPQRPLWPMGWTQFRIPSKHSKRPQIMYICVHAGEQIASHYSTINIRKFPSLIRESSNKKKGKMIAELFSSHQIIRSFSSHRGNATGTTPPLRPHCSCVCVCVSTSPTAATRHRHRVVATPVAVNRVSERPVLFECCQTTGRAT